MEAVLATLEAERIEALICIGGDGTLHAASRVADAGVKIVAIPKTIDNDVAGTDLSIGYNTAVNIAAEAIDRIHTTAESHQRIMVLEVMGRHAGWIATFAGIAGGADEILIPEVPFEIEDVCDTLRARFNRGKTFSIVVVSEGARPKEMERAVTASERVDEFGHGQLGGIGQLLGKEIEARLGVETRVTVLGHVQRGGSPTAHDRVLATRFGVRAIEEVVAGNFGVMVGQQGYRIVPMPLGDVCRMKTVDMDLYEMAKIFF